MNVFYLLISPSPFSFSFLPKCNLKRNWSRTFFNECASGRRFDYLTKDVDDHVGGAGGHRLQHGAGDARGPLGPGKVLVVEALLRRVLVPLVADLADCVPPPAHLFLVRKALLLEGGPGVGLAALGPLQLLLLLGGQPHLGRNRVVHFKNC